MHRKKKVGLYQPLRTVKNDSDFKSKALVQHLVWSHPTNRTYLWGCSCSVHCGRKGRQSLLGSSSWGQRPVGRTAHCSKIELIALMSWSSLSCADSVGGQIPCWASSSVSGSSHIATEINQCLEKVSKSQSSGEVSCGSTYPGQGGGESGDTPRCGSKPLD